MGTKIINKVVSIDAPVNQEAIDMLEHALEGVRCGEITAIGLAWVTKDESVDGCVSRGRHLMLMWGSLQHVAISFYNDVVMGDG